MRNWNKYISSQKYSECQLITALNARYYLTGKFIKQDSAYYERLVDLCGARNGSAIGIEKIYKKLKLDVTKFESWKSFMYDWFPRVYPNESFNKEVLPLEVNVWEKHYGFHSICIVDYEPITECFRIPNFRYQTSLKGWIFNEELYRFVNNHGLEGVKRFRRINGN